jgi:lysophospholipase L1-like esterase
MATRNMVFSLILLMVSLLFSLIAGEMGLRLLGYAGAPESLIGNIRYVDDPILNWRFVPNSTVQDGNVISRYNSAGFRDVEHAIEKPAHVTRVVVVGDSVTEGSGVGQDELFASYVQALLGPRYEIINLGMSGLNTPQEIHIFDVEGMKYAPDIVVVNFILNDCDFFSEFRATERFQNEKDGKIGLLGDITIDPRLKRWLKSSALIYFVKGRMEYLQGVITGKEEKNYYVSLWDNPECHRRVLSGFDALKALQEQFRFDVHVLIWPLLMNYERYSFSYVHAWVKENAAQRGFKVLDLLPVYSSRRYRDLQVTAEDNVHPNGEGHRLTAQAYVDWSHQSSTLSSQ